MAGPQTEKQVVHKRSYEEVYHIFMLSLTSRLCTTRAGLGGTDSPVKIKAIFSSNLEYEPLTPLREKEKHQRNEKFEGGGREQVREEMDWK